MTGLCNNWVWMIHSPEMGKIYKLHMFDMIVVVAK